MVGLLVARVGRKVECMVDLTAANEFGYMRAVGYNPFTLPHRAQLP